MPFEEPGADELSSQRVDIAWSRRARPTPRRPTHIVLTLGTPSFSHIEIDMRDIRAVARRPAAACCARATCSCCARRSRRGTTEFVAGYIEKHRGLEVGEDVFVAHVPERIAAGRFFEEIGTLPCIVGGVGEALGRGARRALFERLGAPIVQTTPVAGRAGEDLDQHPALRDVRAAQPA